MFPYQIDFPDSEVSEGVTRRVEKHLEKLNGHYNRITNARVVVRIPHQHRRRRFYHIRVQLEIPGKTLVVDREPEKDYAHSDVYVSVRDAFDKITRQLDEYVGHRAQPEHQRLDPSDLLQVQTEELEPPRVPSADEVESA